MYFNRIVVIFARKKHNINTSLMKITLNNISEQLPQENCTVLDLLNYKGINRNGTAVSVNDRIVRHSAWESTRLSEGDRVVIISAAFGG